MLFFTTASSNCFAAFACNASPVLKAAFNSRFQEGETQTYILEDVDAEIFDRLVLWIYTQTATFEEINGAEVEPPSKETQASFDEEVLKLLKLWTLGDKLLMPELQNEVMTAITEMWGLGQCHLRSTSWIPYIWEYPIAGSPIHRFVSSHVICWVKKDHCLQHYQDFPPELLMDVLISAHEISTILDKKAETRRLWASLQTESE